MTTLALLGAGQWGKNYLETARELSDVEIKYIVRKTADDDSRSDLKGFQGRTLGIRARDIANVQTDVDGIIIATPASTHYPIAKELLKEQNNLLIEKPLALSVAEARELRDLQKKSGSTILVGHLYLYNPAYRAARDGIPKLGNLKRISFRGIGSTPRDDVSVLWDWGPHPASLFLDLVEASIVEVTASGDSERTRFTLTYQNGMIAEAELAWTGEKKRELIIEGDKGIIILDDAKKENKVMIEVGGAQSFPSYDTTPPLTIELAEFVDAIRGKREILSNIDMGVRITELLSQIEENL